MGITVSLTVNGEAVSRDVEARTLLVELLRQHLRLTGTHVGCDTSQCGACVVHVDGRSVKSCTLLAAQAEGAQVTTIEGLSDEDLPGDLKGDVPEQARSFFGNLEESLLGMGLHETHHRGQIALISALKG